MSLLYPKNNYKFLETTGEAKEKQRKINDNNKMLKDIDQSIKEICKDMSELKKEVREVLELVRKKEERDMNKWLTWG
jgi:DNA-binding ferritin-like protein